MPHDHFWFQRYHEFEFDFPSPTLTIHTRSFFFMKCVITHNPLIVSCNCSLQSQWRRHSHTHMFLLVTLSIAYNKTLHYLVASNAHACGDREHVFKCTNTYEWLTLKTPLRVSRTTAHTGSCSHVRWWSCSPDSGLKYAAFYVCMVTPILLTEDQRIKGSRIRANTTYAGDTHWSMHDHCKHFAHSNRAVGLNILAMR